MPKLTSVDFFSKKVRIITRYGQKLDRIQQSTILAHLEQKIGSDWKRDFKISVVDIEFHVPDRFTQLQ